MVEDKVKTMLPYGQIYDIVYNSMYIDNNIQSYNVTSTHEVVEDMVKTLLPFLGSTKA